MPYPPAWSHTEKVRKICTAAGPNVNNMKSSSVALAASQGAQYCCISSGTVFNFDQFNAALATNFVPIAVDFNNAITVSTRQTLEVKIIDNVGTHPPCFDIGSGTYDILTGIYYYTDGTNTWLVTPTSESFLYYQYLALTTHDSVCPVLISGDQYAFSATLRVTAGLTTLTNEVFTTNVQITGTPVFPFSWNQGSFDVPAQTITFTSPWNGTITYTDLYLTTFSNSKIEVTASDLIMQPDSSWQYTYVYPQTAAFFPIPNPLTNDQINLLVLTQAVFSIATNEIYPSVFGNNTDTPVTLPPLIGPSIDLEPYGALLLAPVTSCFLAGSLVTLADGTTKAIEDVQVGDVVLGAFGEHNTVLKVKRGVLGQGRMCKINGDHVTTLNHPHITPAKQFVSCNSATDSDGSVLIDPHCIIANTASDTAYYALFELKKGRIQPLQIGTELQGVDGARVVRSLESMVLPTTTPIFNLAVSGSHTYFVNGYAVTGDMKESDFDVDSWKSNV